MGQESSVIASLAGSSPQYVFAVVVTA